MRPLVMNNKNWTMKKEQNKNGLPKGYITEILQSSKSRFRQ
jgi:hypothetical protein